MPPEIVQNQPEPTGAPPQPLVNDEGNPLPTAVEVDIRPEDLGNAPVTIDPAVAPGTEPAAAPAAAEPAPTGRSRVPANTRIAQLVKNVHAERSEKEQIQRERDEARALAAQAHARATQSDQAAIAYYEQATEANIANARRELQEAIQAGDALKQSEVTERLTKFGADKAMLEGWKAAQPKPVEQQQQPQQRHQQAQQPQAVEQVEVSPEVAAWIDENPWFDKKSPEFDPGLHQIASGFATILERKYKAEGKAYDQTYWDAINAHMTQYLDPGAPPAAAQPAPRAPVARGLSDVAPATRAGTPAAGAPLAGRPGSRITLAPEERQIAHRLVDAGAISFPVGHQKYGKRPNHTEGEYLYAIQKMNGSK